MARLKEYNGHYCESEYEYAFHWLFRRQRDGNILLEISFLVSPKEMC